MPLTEIFYMSEEIDGKQVFSLMEVTKSIQKTLAKRYRRIYWIKAEMNKLNYYQYSGHCYPDLVEKKSGKVVAQIRANLWKSDYRKINRKFKKLLHEPLKSGIKVLFAARIKFHPKYGLSLQIVDMDPGFTLGDLEQEKQETLGKLEAEGILFKNQDQKLPLLPQRIAVISVETSNGYADFREVLNDAKANRNYHFYDELFPSLLQGDRAVKQMLGQLQRIREVKDKFDLVVIVRGGGGEVGLSCYNHYDLAREIALFPLPVVTGIGHSTNKTVAEQIAFQNAITPTKLGEYLVGMFEKYANDVAGAEQKIVEKTRKMLQAENHNLNMLTKLLQSGSKTIVTANLNRLQRQTDSLSRDLKYRLGSESDRLSTSIDTIKKEVFRGCLVAYQNLDQIRRNLPKLANQKIEKEKLRLKNIDKSIEILNPKNVLRRGYSITLLKDNPVRTTRDLKEGDTVVTHLYEGEFKGTIESIKNQDNGQ